jgi:hypothetical protein
MVSDTTNVEKIRGVCVDAKQAKYAGSIHNKSNSAIYKVQSYKLID